MDADDTRLTLRRAPVPTPGPVSLVYGEKEGVSLVFGRPPVATPGPVRLVFGDDGAAPPATPDATLTATGRITGLRGHIGVLTSTSLQAAGVITGLRGTVLVRAIVQVQAAGQITGLRLRIAAVYNVNASRPTVGQVAARYQQAAPAQVGVADSYQQSLPATSGAKAHWQDAQKVQALLRTAWQESERLAAWARVAYQQAIALPTLPTHQRYQEAQPLRNGSDVRFQEATRLPTVPLLQRYQEAMHLRSGGVQRYQEAQHLSSGAVQWTGYGMPLSARLGVRYQEAWPPRPGMWVKPPIPADPPCYLPTLPARLIFIDPTDSTLPARLVFKCDNPGPGPDPYPGETVVVPIKEVYLTINSAVLVRLDNGYFIPATSMSMGLDVDSWTWSFSASVPGAALPLVQHNSNGDPVVVQATINGTAFRFIVESVGRDRTFNSSQLRIQGRGLSAELSSPYAPTMGFGNDQERTARQLLDDILTINGVSIGWGVNNFGPTDWLVPAGAFNHSGSYITALNAVVGSVGAYLQPHNTDRTFDVALRYPTPAWEWAGATPDFVLPAAVTSQEGFAWSEKPLYNRVYVSGQQDGIQGRYSRAGTAGDLLAPPVVDPLITHADAARQRGRTILSDTGRIATVTLRLPVLAETGIIKPGKFVHYQEGANTHVGMTRAVSVDVGLPTIYQTLTVETHLEPV